MKKTVTILEHNGGRLGNQLWSHISVLAYCLERGYECRNLSFSEYGHGFKIKKTSALADMISHLTSGKIEKKISTLVVKKIKNIPDACIIDSGDEVEGDRAISFYLPPSVDPRAEHTKLIEKMEDKNTDQVFLTGWLWRNPVGIEKHRAEIVRAVMPMISVVKRVDAFLAEIRSTHSSEKIIGVHIRQGDYKGYMDGRFYFTQSEVRVILDEYVKNVETLKEKVHFVICSDATIDDKIFAGLSYTKGLGEAVADLTTLSKTDAIIASDSTFSSFAAYYGNIPIILFSREKEKMDWKKFAAEKKFDYYHGSYNLQP